MAETEKPRSRKDLLRLIEENLEAEREDALTYRRLASQETDPTRRNLLERMADSEERHARTWEEKLREYGGSVRPDSLSLGARVRLWLAAKMGPEAAIRRRETGEHVTEERYRQMEERYSHEAGDVLNQIRAEERSHARKLRVMAETHGPARALSFQFGREHWHRHEHNWLSDAIYGANDGLGAVFGIVSGVAGYRDVGHYVLISGLAGMIASALSMGAGAYLAAKSERELYDAEIRRESMEIEEQPEEEREEMALFYQLKGFTEAEAKALVERMQSDPQQFLRTMAAEELGFAGEPTRKPGPAAWSAGLSTAAGAIIPVVPFFFLTGITAVVVAFIVSLAAHFAVGAAKSLFTNRSWFWSGAEMTIVGVIEAVVTYGVGSLAAHYI
jgi:VIT1/CCC1 family predicted Fe2+/Mn2+ transporter/rubrerythrin